MLMPNSNIVCFHSKTPVKVYKSHLWKHCFFSKLIKDLMMSLPQESESFPKRSATPSTTFLGSLPSSGLSEVTGIVSDTVLRNTVNDRRIVTPVERRKREGGRK